MDDLSWFEYGLTVQPHHTDYAGIVWHGTYIAWMEEARIAYLQERGMNFADWVRAGVDLPVVDLCLRYRQSLTLGQQALVRTRLEPFRGVRLVWHYDIQRVDTGITCLEGRVTLATVDLNSRRVLRRLPDGLQKVFE
ncbi:MAG: acyl-CoA thioesterase [Nodosilinea sp.]